LDTDTKGPAISAQLLAMGDSLLFYSAALGKHDAGVRVKALLDCGASHTFISRETLRNYPSLGSVKKNSQELRVKMPDGGRLVTDTSIQIPLALGSWRGIITAWILDLPDYEFILGRDFLRSVNPSIDWVSSRMKIRDYRRTYMIESVGSRTTLSCDDASFNLLSAKQTSRAIRKKGTEATLAIVRSRNEPTKAEQTGSIPTHKDPKVIEILQKHSEVFRDALPDELPPERAISHNIHTGDAEPVNINSYPLSDEKLQEQMRQIEDLLKKGLIRPSASAWGFPVIFVKKPNGTWRMCIDYRALNNLTSKNGYPLPRIQDLLDRVGTARFLTKIDLAAGYWQIRMGQDSVEKTAFNTIWGKYEWLAMPFGLCNAPATFQTIMNETLRPFLGKFAVVYLDDILIYSDTREEHYDHLDKVLEALKKEQLIAQPAKCSIAVTELEFCGHIIGNGQIRPVPGKVEIIRTWPRPRNVHEVRQFVGLATYYRRFIRGFAQICVPLHELFKETDVDLRKQKFRPVAWTITCESAFRALKNALVDAPVLIQADRSKPFIIETDASEWAIGMVLLQLGEDRILHPVAFDGRKLTGAELNYPVHEKELLAIKEALRKWDQYIENGMTTTIVTDHASLQYLQTTVVYSKRLARWVEEFQEYDLKIQYRKGSDAVVPDALSRRPDFIGDGPANVSKSRPVWDVALNITAAVEYSRTVMQVPEEEWYDATVRFLECQKLPDDKLTARAVARFAPNLSLSDSKDAGGRVLVFAHEDRLRVPYIESPYRGDLLHRVHKEFGHLGYPGLNGVVKPRGWWPQMRYDIEQTSKNCPECQVSQGSRKSLEREAAQHMVTAGIRPFQRWGIDFIGRLPTTPNSNRWIITAIDYATGWPVTQAVPKADEETVGQFLHDRIFADYGAPMELISDQGTSFMSGVVAHYLKLMQTKHKTTTPYHPRTNGKVENFNGLIGRMLTKYLINKPIKAWDLYLSTATVAARYHEHTNTGFSPYYLVYGMHPRIPSDDSELPQSFSSREVELEHVQDARTKANELLLARAIRTNRIRDSLVTKTSFQKGAWVLVRNENGKKFESKWFGPYRVLESHPLGTYALEEPNGRVLRNLINGSRLLEANVTEPTRLWTSPAARNAMRRAGIRLRRPEELQKVLENEDSPPTYSDLSTFTREEWDELRRNGARHEKVGEDAIALRVIEKNRSLPRRNKKDWEEIQSEASESDNSLSDEGRDSSLHDKDREDYSLCKPAEERIALAEDVQGGQDADAAKRTWFEGPLAVVIPTKRTGRH
jgi:transposase InsO family protein